MRRSTISCLSDLTNHLKIYFLIECKIALNHINQDKAFFGVVINDIHSING